MPKLIKKRISKKTADSETEVQERFYSFKDTIKEKRQTVIKYAIGILVIAIAIIGFLVYSYTSEKRAKALVYDAYKIYYSKSQNSEEQFMKALTIFEKAYDTSKSPVALFYIAACHYELGKYDEALRVLKDFSQRYSGDEKFIPLAYQKMTMIYLKKGAVDEAKKTLDGLYGLKDDLFKDFALMEYGKILEKEGKADEARKKYEELTKKFPNSPFKEEAEARLKKQG